MMAGVPSLPEGGGRAWRRLGLLRGGAAPQRRLWCELVDDSDDEGGDVTEATGCGVERASQDDEGRRGEGLRGGMPGAGAATRRRRQETNLRESLRGLLTDPDGGGAPAGHAPSGPARPAKSKQAKKQDKFDLHSELVAILEHPGGDLLRRLRGALHKADAVRAQRAGNQQRAEGVERKGAQAAAFTQARAAAKAVPKQSFYTQFLTQKAGAAVPETAGGSDRKSRRPRVLPGAWKDVALASTVRAALEQGDEPRGEVSVVTRAEAEEFRRLAKAHGLAKPHALVVYDIEEQGPLPEGAKVQWVTFDVGIRKVWVMDLVPGSPAVGVPAKIPEVQKVKVTVDVPKLEALRIVVAKELVEPSFWATFLKGPAQQVKEALASGIEFHAYGWQTEVVMGRTRATGFIKVRAGLVEKVLAAAGTRGIFAQRLRAARPEESAGPAVAWVSKEPQESEVAYLTRCCGLAKEQGKPLRLRQGGGAAIGIVGGTQGPGPGGARFVLFGAPREWTPEVLVSILQEWGWSGVRGVAAPRHQKQGYLFTGAQPKTSANKDDFVYEVAEPNEATVTIRRWIRAPTEAGQAQKLAKAAAWIPSAAQPSPQPASAGPPNRRAPGEGAAQITDDVVMSDSEAPPEQAVKKARTETGLPQPAPARPPPAPGPGGSRLWDVGGHGDCALRAIVASEAVRNKASKEAATAKIDKLKVTLHTRMVAVLEQTLPSWKEAWWHDAAATEEMEGGPRPKTAEEWLAAVRDRPLRWACARTLQACAAAQRVDILVFEWAAGKWKVPVRFLAAKQVNKRDFIVLALKDQHYTAIDRGTYRPEWAALTGEAVAPLEWRSRGGVGSTASRGSARTNTTARMLRPGRAVSSAGGSAALPTCTRSGRPASQPDRRHRSGSGAASAASTTARMLRPGGSSAGTRSLATAGRKRRRVEEDTETLAMLRPAPEGPADRQEEDAGRFAPVREGRSWRPGDVYVCPCGWRPTAVPGKMHGQAQRHWSRCQGTVPPKMSKAAWSYKQSQTDIGDRTAARGIQSYKAWRASFVKTHPDLACGLCEPSFEVAFGRAFRTHNERRYVCQRCGREAPVTKFRISYCKAVDRATWDAPQWYRATLGQDRWERRRKQVAEVRQRLNPPKGRGGDFNAHVGLRGQRAHEEWVSKMRQLMAPRLRAAICDVDLSKHEKSAAKHRSRLYGCRRCACQAPLGEFRRRPCRRHELTSAEVAEWRRKARGPATEAQ